MKTKALIFYILLFIPILNVLADVTIYYFREPGGAQFHPGIIRGGFLAIMGLWFIFRGYLNTRESVSILLFLIYAFIVSLFSSDINHSFLGGYLKWFSSLLLFPIGYWVIDNEKKLKLLLNIYLIIAVIICANLLYAQITQFGITTYLEDTFYTGGAGVGITNNLAIIILSSILLFEDHQYSTTRKILFFGIIFVSLVFVLISLKRAAILGLSLGTISFMFYSKRKSNLLKYLGILLFALVLSFPLFEDILMPRLEVRLDEMEQIENEARLKDFDNVMNEMKQGNISLILFGTEAFNSKQFYGPRYFGRNRVIHGDFTGIWYGTGTIGLLLFSQIFIVLLYWFYKKRNIKNPLLRRLLITFFSVLICFLLISLTGSGSIGFLCLVFLLLGSIKRVYDEMERKDLYEKNSALN